MLLEDPIARFRRRLDVRARIREQDELLQPHDLRTAIRRQVERARRERGRHVRPIEDLLCQGLSGILTHNHLRFAWMIPSHATRCTNGFSSVCGWLKRKEM